MPANWLTDREQRRLTRFPAAVSENEIVTFFTLTENDWRRLTKLHHSVNRLGFALQLGALRHLGFVPENLTEAPAAVVEFLAAQLSAAPELLAGYGSRVQTRTDHLSEIEAYLGFHQATKAEEAEIDAWLTARAVEHDRPLLLLQMLCERLQSHKIIRFSLTRLERSVVRARQQARTMTWRTVAPLIDDETAARLNDLLLTDESGRRTPLNWLRTGRPLPPRRRFCRV